MSPHEIEGLHGHVRFPRVSGDEPRIPKCGQVGVGVFPA